MRDESRLRGQLGLFPIELVLDVSRETTEGSMLLTDLVRWLYEMEERLSIVEGALSNMDMSTLEEVAEDAAKALRTVQKARRPARPQAARLGKGGQHGDSR